MQVYEEYCKRHSIRVPFVKHAQIGFFFLRELNEEPARNWTILSINWNNPNTHPGTYVVRRMYPSHDSGCFETYNDTKIVLGSDEYENYFYKWSTTCKKETICQNTKEITLTAWEMFVYCNDHTFSKYLNDYSSIIFNSLNYDSPVSNRYLSYLKIIRLVGRQSKFISLFNAWDANLTRYITHYSTWLIELVKENGC